MEFSPAVNGCLKPECRPRVRLAALGAVAATLLIASVGCGTKSAEQNAAVTTAGDSKSAGDTGGRKSATTGAARSEAGSSGATHRVVLTEKGCVEFEPQWAEIRVGQSVTWHSDLKSAVTLHLSPGGFDRSEFVVRPGGSTSSGPARSAGSYSVWTEPAACQGAPRGVRGSGPGVIVEGGASSR